MMSQVAGPIAFAPWDGDLTFSVSMGVWVDELGGIVAIADAGSTYPGNLVLIKTDGTIMRIGGGGRTWEALGWAQDADARREDLLASTSASPSSTDRVTLPEIGEVSSDTVYIWSQLVALLVGDRYIRFDGSTVIAVEPPGGSEYDECAIAAGVGPGAIMPADLSGDRSEWWLVDLGNGKVFRYDAIAKAELGEYRTSFGAGAVGMPTYSRKHNVFGAVFSDHLYFFSPEPKAYALAPPEFSATPRAGQRCEISAVLTGSDGEPCPERVIRFAVTDGAVPLPKVETDATGTARTYYEAPYNPSEDNEATAELVE